MFNPAPGGGLSGSRPIDVNTTFLDVPTSFWAAAFIDALADAGITSGCGSRRFCPEETVTRAQAAIFLVRGMAGPEAPPPATGMVFVDVTADSFAADWIEQLAAMGITAGCGGNAYCPQRAMTRGEMAVFLLRAKHGASYQPPSASGSVFSDVPTNHPFAPWIEQLAAEGISAGCASNRYCPENPVTRAQMAVFLVRTFAGDCTERGVPSAAIRRGTIGTKVLNYGIQRESGGLDTPEMCSLVGLDLAQVLLVGRGFTGPDLAFP